MDDVICLSSSDDEDTEKANKSQEKSLPKSVKRPLSLSSSSFHSKKRKLEQDNNDFDSKKPIFLHEDYHKPGTSRQSEFLNYSAHEKESTSDDDTSDSPKRTNSINVEKFKPKLIIKEKVAIPDPSEDIFEEFITTCKRKKSDKDTLDILNKLSKRYDRLDEKFKKDEEFRIFIKKYIQKIDVGLHEKFYVHIQEVNNEIKRRTTKRPKLEKVEKVDSPCELEENNLESLEQDSEDNTEVTFLSKEDRKRVKKLENAILKCKQKIKELEEREVNFDEEEDSAYLQEDRYKRKLVELCQMLSNIVDDKMLKRELYKKQLRRKDITSDMTGIPAVDDAIINYINLSIKKINKLKHIKNTNAIPDYLKLPDISDIFRIIKKHNEKEDLDLSTKKMEKLAHIALKSVGGYLKKKRIRESENYLTSFVEIDTEKDPALHNTELLEKLKKNKIDGDKKLNEVFKLFVDKQEGLSAEDLQKQEMNNSSSADESENEVSNQHKSQNENLKIFKTKEIEKTKINSSQNSVLDTDNGDESILTKKLGSNKIDKESSQRRIHHQDLHQNESNEKNTTLEKNDTNDFHKKEQSKNKGAAKMLSVVLIKQSKDENLNKIKSKEIAKGNTSFTQNSLIDNDEDDGYILAKKLNKEKDEKKNEKNPFYQDLSKDESNEKNDSFDFHKKKQIKNREADKISSVIASNKQTRDENLNKINTKEIEKKIINYTQNSILDIDDGNENILTKKSGNDKKNSEESQKNFHHQDLHKNKSNEKNTCLEKNDTNDFPKKKQITENDIILSPIVSNKNNDHHTNNLNKSSEVENNLNFFKESNDSSKNTKQDDEILEISADYNYNTSKQTLTKHLDSDSSETKINEHDKEIQKEKVLDELKPVLTVDYDDENSGESIKILDKIEISDRKSIQKKEDSMKTLDKIELPENKTAEKEVTKKSPCGAKNMDEKLNHKSFLIKPCDFAKQPNSWIDVSPTKDKKNSNISSYKIPRKPEISRKEEIVDLTDEKDDKPSYSYGKKDINPMASVHTRRPVKNMVVVKNVVNNYTVVSGSSSNSGRSNIPPPKHFNINNSIETKTNTYVTNSTDKTFVKQVSARHQMPSIVSRNTINRSFSELPKDKTSSNRIPREYAFNFDK